MYRITHECDELFERDTDSVVCLYLSTAAFNRSVCDGDESSFTAQYPYDTYLDLSQKVVFEVQRDTTVFCIRVARFALLFYLHTSI